MRDINYMQTCFVIMPFGKKLVGATNIDFDFIYHQIFVPAIKSTQLPEGGTLIPKRTDQDFFSAYIDLEMFKYIEYSRLTLVDITGLNPNVFYELGVRHHAHPTGTPIFRQSNAAIPFDINHIKAFPYEYEPDEQIQISIDLVKEVLKESLAYNKIDSPIQIALTAQRTLGINIDEFLKDAENAIRHGNWSLAINKYKEAINTNPMNPVLYLELGILYKKQGDWINAERSFKKAVDFSPNYSDAQRELGIAQNKIFHKYKDTFNLPTGEAALREAIKLNDQDFDAYSSLGGILKRQGLYQEAWKHYNKANLISRGHPYPLLNEIKLQICLDGELKLTDKQKFQLNQAERMRKSQAQNMPPFDAPWCFFDLSDIKLYFGQLEEFINYLNEGLFNCKDKWEAQTHLDSIELTLNVFGKIPEVKKALQLIEETIPFLNNPEN